MDSKKFKVLKTFTDDADGDEDEESKEEYKSFSYTNAILFLVDGRKKMFTKGSDNNVPFIQCFQCIISCLRNKIFTFEKAQCGIMVLGTKNADHVNVISPLKKIGADEIIACQELIKGVVNDTYEKEYGYGDISIADSIWMGARMFSESLKSLKANKSIIFFTNDDNPHGNDTTEYRRALKSASDMQENSIIFDLIHLGENFDPTCFFKEFLQLARGDTNYKIPDPSTRMKEMLERVIKINYRHVSLVKLPLKISDDFQIGVSVHYLVRKVKAPSKVKLSRATNEKVTTKMQLFDSESGEVVENENIQKYHSFAGKDVGFKLDELKEIKEMGERGLRLMGFKPRSVIQLDNYIKPAAFIYPDETYCKGSASFFTALLKRCQAKDVVAICTYYPRPDSEIRFVALIPHEEEINADKTQLSPTGFIVFFLPFADEIRDLDEKCTGKKRAAPEQVDLAKKIIKKLKFSYKPDCFSNPKLRTHWAAIEALALNLKEPETINDNTMPDYDTIKERLKSLTERFYEEVYPPDYDPKVTVPAQRPRKETQKEVSEPLVDPEFVEEKARDKSITRLTNDVLKNYLQVKGVKVHSKMKKSDFIDAVYQHLGIPN